MERNQGEPAQPPAGRLRIMHVSDVYLPRLGGIELHVHDLAQRQRARGHDVRVVTMTGADGLTDPQVQRPAGGSVRARLRLAGSLGKLIATQRPDVVHVHLSTVSPLAIGALLAARRTMRAGAVTVVTVHSLWRGYIGLCRAADRMVGWSRWPVTWSAVSRASAECVHSAATHPIEIAVIPNGIDLPAWTCIDWRPEPGALHVASVMRLTARKRPMALLRMLREVRRRLPPTMAMTATVVGDGPARRSMQRYLDRAGMDWVEMAGRLDRGEVARQLARAHAYLAPATLEAFGIAVLEARAIGLPVVARSGTGVADFVVNGRDGVLCPDDDAMIDAVVSCATSQPSGDRPSHPCPATMDWTSVLDVTDQLYDRARTDALIGSAPTASTPLSHAS